MGEQQCKCTVVSVTHHNSPFSFIFHVLRKDLQTPSALIVRERGEHVVEVEGVVVEETSVRDAAPLAL
jgi:hypothetical protein